MFAFSLTFVFNKCIKDIVKMMLISSRTYKNVVTQKVQLFRRAQKNIFKGQGQVHFRMNFAISKCRISGVRTIKP